MEKRLIFFLILVMIIWGGSWTIGKMLSSSAAPEVMIFWRFFLAAVCMLPFFAVFKQKMKIAKKAVLWLALSGFIMVLYNLGYFIGLQYGLASAGGVLVTTLNPIFTYFVTSVILKHKSKKIQIAALFIGLTGGAVMLEVWTLSLDQLLKSGNLFFLAASLVWVFLTMVSHKLQKVIHFIPYSFYTYAFAAFISLVFSVITGNITSVPVEGSFWLQILYLSVLTTALATTYYFIATSRLGSRKASSFIFTVPVSAVLISWLVLNEVPAVSLIIGGCLAVAAVFLINYKKAV